MAASISTTANFWFNVDGHAIRNSSRPLMTPDEMEGLPFPQYREPGEMMYRIGKGFSPMRLAHYLANEGLGYATVRAAPAARLVHSDDTVVIGPTKRRASLI